MNLNKYILLTVFILSINLFLQAETKFYRHIDTLVNYEYQFKNEITPESAAKSICYKVDFDKDGRPLQVTFQKMENIRIDTDNVGITKIEYSENMELRTYFNESDEPTYNTAGNYHSLRIERLNENTQLASYYDIDTNQIPDTKNIYYLLIRSNSKKTVFAVNTMDKDKIKIPINNIYEKKYQYNHQKDLIIKTSYNRLGMLQDDGNIAITRVMRGNKVKKTLHFNMFDEQVELASKKAGFNIYNNKTKTNEFKIFDRVAATIVKYDINGYMISKANINLKNVYTYDRNQVCLYNYEYSEKGELLAQTNYNISNEVCEDALGIHRYEYSYDDDGNRIEERKIRINKPKVEYTPILKSEFNDSGMIVKQRFFQEDGKQQEVDNVFGFTFEYDQFSNIIRKGYLNIKGEATIYEGSYNYKIDKYNRKNELVEISYEKIDGTLGKVEAGYSLKKFNEDYENRLSSIEFYSGKTRDEIKPVNVYGVAKIMRTYDAHRNLLKKEYFNKNNERVNGTKGFSIVSYNYDENFNNIELSYYDKNEKLTIPDEGHFAKLIKEYDSNGFWTKMEYYGKSDKLKSTGVCAAITRKINESCMITEMKHFDEDYELIRLRDKKYSYFNKVYDEFGNLREHKFYDTEGNLTNNKHGYAIIKFDYTETEGFISRINYYDKNEIPVISKKDKCASVKYFYDESARISEIQYLNLDYELENVSKGSLQIAIMRYTYGEDGLKNEKHYYDEDGVFVKKFKVDNSKLKWEVFINFLFDEDMTTYQ